MTDRERIVGRIDPEIKKRFQEFVEETTGGNQGDQSRLMERALEEYMDNDRGARIESKVDDVIDKLDEFEEPPSPRSEESSERERQSATTSNPTADSFNNQTEQAVQAIAADMPDGTSITESMVETAIEDNAGASYKTVKKYKRLLKKRGHAIPSPITDEDQWYTSQTALALRCENAKNVTPHDINDLVGQYMESLGREWYLDALPDDWMEDRELKYDRHPELDSSAYRRDHSLEADSKTFQ